MRDLVPNIVLILCVSLAPAVRLWRFGCRLVPLLLLLLVGFVVVARPAGAQQVYEAPVGLYRPNAFGLYDVLGNVWEWVDGCWNDGYGGAATDGSSWYAGDCGKRMLRGGSWYYGPGDLRSANRREFLVDYRGQAFGFRVARAVN